VSGFFIFSVDDGILFALSEIAFSCVRRGGQERIDNRAHPFEEKRFIYRPLKTGLFLFPTFLNCKALSAF